MVLGSCIFLHRESSRNLKMQHRSCQEIWDDSTHLSCRSMLGLILAALIGLVVGGERCGSKGCSSLLVGSQMEPGEWLSSPSSAWVFVVSEAGISVRSSSSAIAAGVLWEVPVTSAAQLQLATNGLLLRDASDVLWRQPTPDAAVRCCCCCYPAADCCCCYCIPPPAAAISLCCLFAADIAREHCEG